MNTKRLVLAMLLTATAVGLTQAQSFYPALKKYSADEKKQLDNTYANLLNCRDTNYLDNAIATVTMIKMDLPNDEFPLIREKIEYISTHSESPAIRYRACLAKMVFANTAMFKDESEVRYHTVSEFFSAVAQKAGITSASIR